MEHQVTISIEFMMKSHFELARILEAERHVAAHVCKVINAVPDRPDAFGTGQSAVKLSLELTQNIAAYLSSLGDLEEAIADNLELVMGELQIDTAAE